MKIALIGVGKTGGRVKELIEHSTEHELVECFNSQKPFQSELVEHAQGIIMFVPGQALEALLPELSKVKIPIVSGVTGYEFDENFRQMINQNQQTWIQAHNFSIGSRDGTSDFFAGKIDEVRIYNRVLTPTEVQAVFTGNP